MNIFFNYYIQTYLYGFVQYLRKPYQVEKIFRKIPIWKMLLFYSPILLLLTGVSLFIMIVLLIPINQVLHDYNFVFETFINNEHVARTRQSMTTIQLLLASSVIAPIIEEIGFRLYLKYSKLNLALSISFLVYYYLPGKGFSSDLGTYLMLEFYIRLLYLAFTFLLVYFVLNFKKIEDLIGNIWNKKFSYIFYFSAFLFGTIHIFNNNISLYTVLFGPIIQLSTIVGGIVFGYVRVKHGIKYSIALHSLNNFVVWLL